MPAFKIRLSTRLFLALLLSLMIPLGFMMVAVHWSFRSGFTEFLHQQELEKLHRLVGALSREYRIHGSWGFVHHNPRDWKKLVRQLLNDGTDEPDPEPNRPERPESPLHGHEPPPPGHPPYGRGPGFRVRLLDADRQVLAGPPRWPKDHHESAETQGLMPITSEGRIVGWLEVARSPKLPNQLAEAFVAQQTRIDLIVLLLVLAIAALVSMLLSRQILRPLHRIASGTRTLATGNFDVSLPVTTDELGELAQDFNQLAATLKSHETARRRWFADISHELRTPLAILQGEIECLMDGVRSVTPERIQSLHAEVITVNRLVEDLNQLSLADLGALSYRRETLELAALAETALYNHQGRFALKAISLKSRLDSNLWILGDPARLSQLLGNLLENSCRYTEAGGVCLVVLEKQGDQAHLFLEDSEPGVSEENLEKLFDPLFRVDVSRSREYGGSGLGLAISKRIVEAHQGSIRAAPSSLGGLKISVLLPLTGGRPETGA